MSHRIEGCSLHKSEPTTDKIGAVRFQELQGRIRLAVTRCFRLAALYYGLFETEAGAILAEGFRTGCALEGCACLAAHMQ